MKLISLASGSKGNAKLIFTPGASIRRVIEFHDVSAFVVVCPLIINRYIGDV